MAAKDADVAKHLSFEDVSMHSPGVFSRFEAQRAREQPTLANLRRCAAPPRAFFAALRRSMATHRSRGCVVRVAGCLLRLGMRRSTTSAFCRLRWTRLTAWATPT
jgi:hypothetical protein